MPDSQRPHELQPSRLLCPWDFPGKSTGVWCHCLLQDLHDSDNRDGVMTYLEPDIVEWKDKWVLGSVTTNKASRGDRIPVEVFQILIYHETWTIQQWPPDWEMSVFTPVPKKGNAKECSNYCTIELVSHASKVMLKIIQDGLQQHENHELPDVQAGFIRGSRTRDQIASICWIMEKAREFQKKHLFLLYWLCQSLWLCGSQ